MDRVWLASRLEEGLSLERIGERAARHPSTVGYWVERHGLVAVHRERHLGKGPLARELLTELVAEGLSLRKIAGRTGRSYATVRHWLRQHELETVGTSRRKALRAARETGERDQLIVCPRHGEVPHRVTPGRGFRCLLCRSEAVVARRRRVKTTLVEEAGGQCALCGYDRSPAALHFHHLDRGLKAFAVSRNGVARSLQSAREEARKCLLVCANCHAEIESGLVAVDTSEVAHGPG